MWRVPRSTEAHKHPVLVTVTVLPLESAKDNQGVPLTVPIGVLQDDAPLPVTTDSKARLRWTHDTS